MAMMESNVILDESHQETALDRVTIGRGDVSLAALSLFTLLEHSTATSHIPASFNVLSLATSIRPVSLGRCSKSMSIPLVLKGFALANLSGVVSFLIASRKDNVNFQCNLQTPRSHSDILDDKSDMFRADGLVSVFEFDPKERKKHEIGVTQHSDLDAILAIVCGNKGFLKGATIQDKVFAILKGVDELLVPSDSGETAPDQMAIPFSRVFNKLYRGVYNIDDDDPIVINNTFRENMPSRELFDILVRSQSDFEGGILAQTLDPARSSQQARNLVQCASWHGSHALIRQVCAVFLSIVDGNHRLMDAIMSLGGFAYKTEVSETSLILEPTTARADFALHSPRVAMSMYQPAGVRHVDLQHAVQYLLNQSKLGADLTKRTAALHEPIHGTLSLLLNFLNDDSPFKARVDLSRAIRQFLDTTSGVGVLQRSSALISAIKSRRAAIAYFCCKSSIAEESALGDDMLLSGVSLSQLLEASSVDENALEALTAVLTPSEQRRNSGDLHQIHSQGAIEVALAGGELVIADMEEDSSEAISLRNAITESPSTSSNIAFMDAMMHTNAGVKSIIKVLQSHHNNRNSSTAWDRHLMMDCVALHWRVYEMLPAFLKSAYNNLHISSRKDKELAQAFLKAILYVYLPSMLSTLIDLVGFDSPVLVRLENHLRWPDHLFRCRRALTFKFLEIALQHPSDVGRVGDFPMEMHQRINKIKLAFLFDIFRQNINLRDFSKSTPEMIEELKDNILDGGSIELLYEMYQVVLEYVPAVVKKLRVDDVTGTAAVATSSLAAAAAAPSATLTTTASTGTATTTSKKKKKKKHKKRQRQEEGDKIDTVATASLPSATETMTATTVPATTTTKKKKKKKRKKRQRVEDGDENVNPQTQQVKKPDEQEQEEEEEDVTAEEEDVTMDRIALNGIQGVSNVLVARMEETWTQAVAEAPSDAPMTDFRTALESLRQRSLDWDRTHGRFHSYE